MRRFRFVYAHPREVFGSDNLERARSQIVVREKKLIERLAPACNAIHIPGGRTPATVSLATVQTYLEEAVESI